MNWMNVNNDNKTMPDIGLIDGSMLDANVTIYKIKKELIFAENQVRQVFEQKALNELMADIEDRGQEQPIYVKKIDDRYRIISGERRWRAINQSVKVDYVLAIITDMDEDAIILSQLAENIQRENLKPFELAEKFNMLILKNGWTITQLADNIHKDRGFVSRALSLNEDSLHIITKQFSEQHGVYDLWALSNLNRIAHSDETVALEIVSRYAIGEISIKEIREYKIEKKITNKTKDKKPNKKNRLRAVDVIDVEIKSEGGKHVLIVEKAKEIVQFNISDDFLQKLKGL